MANISTKYITPPKKMIPFFPCNMHSKNPIKVIGQNIIVTTKTIRSIVVRALKINYSCFRYI